MRADAGLAAGRGRRPAAACWSSTPKPAEVALRARRRQAAARWPRTRSSSRPRRRSPNSGPNRAIPTKVFDRRHGRRRRASSTAASTCRAAATRRSARPPSTTANWRASDQHLRPRAAAEAAGITRSPAASTATTRSSTADGGRRLGLRDQPLHRPALRPRLQLGLRRQHQLEPTSPPTRRSWRPQTLARSAATRPDQGQPTQIALGTTPADAKSVAVVHSPTADSDRQHHRRLLRQFFAEMLKKLLGARFGERRDDRRRGQRRRATSRARIGSGVRAGRRLRPDPLQPRLARQTSSNLLLGDATRAAIGDEFIQDLALSGKEGTVAERMAGPPPTAAAAPRPARYRGQPSPATASTPAASVLAFSILMGSVRDFDAHKHQDRIAAGVARYRPWPRRRAARYQAPDPLPVAERSQQARPRPAPRCRAPRLSRASSPGCPPRPRSRSSSRPSW